MKKEYVEAEIEIIFVSPLGIMSSSDPGLDDPDWDLVI